MDPRQDSPSPYGPAPGAPSHSPLVPPPASPPPTAPPTASAPAPRRRGALRRFGSGLMRALDFSRRLALNLLFLFVVALLLGAIFGGGAVIVPQQAVLVLRPEGTIVEQLSGDPTSRALDRLTGSVVPETLLRDLVRALEAARDDERIKAVHLDLDRMLGAGLTTSQEIRRLLLELRAAGKPVLAEASFLTRGRYHLASAADEIYLHPMGFVLLDGYGVYPTYYKEGLDRLDVDWHVFRVGEYKSAVEPFLRNDMSAESRAANAEWLGDLWRLYLADVAEAREVSAEAIAEGIERLPELLAVHGGDGATVAAKLGLVDHVASRDVLRQRFIELVGEDESSHSFRQVELEDYLLAIGDDGPGPLSGDRVGVLVARGPIVDGSHPPGTIGGDSTADLIREARHDEGIKALLLRVDSGGGSTFASEVIRRELELFREAGKPVVVSMGSVAASGGYWIATSADEVWAAPTTITGSIGIFGMFPTIDRALSEHLGIHVDGVGTNWLSGSFRLDRPLDPRMATVIQSITEQGYGEFLERVAAAREMTVEEVDRIARGRVWSGVDARELGLVDQLGDFDGALAAAARLGELGEDFEVEYLEQPLDVYDQLFLELVSRVEGRWPAARRAAERRPSAQLLAGVERFLDRQLATLARFDDPRGLYSYCFCEVD